MHQPRLSFPKPSWAIDPGLLGTLSEPTASVLGRMENYFVQYVNAKRYSLVIFGAWWGCK